MEMRRKDLAVTEPERIDALTDEEVYILFVGVALAEVTLEDAGDPDGVLLWIGFIQVIVLSQLLLGLLTDVLAVGHGGNRVRGGDADHGEDQHRDRNEDQDHLSQPLENEFSHGNTSLFGLFCLAPGRKIKKRGQNIAASRPVNMPGG